MKKILAVVLALSLTALLLSGCSGIGSMVSGIKDKVDSLTAAGLVVRVTRLEDNGSVRCKVVNGDSHFDTTDELYVYYNQVAGTNGTNKLKVTDQLSVSYDYTTNVSVEGKYPVIRVEVVSLYVPD